MEAALVSAGLAVFFYQSLAIVEFTKPKEIVLDTLQGGVSLSVAVFLLEINWENRQTPSVFLVLSERTAVLVP